MPARRVLVCPQGAGGVLTATPTFSPVAGTYGSTQNVVISDASPSPVIHYTTDGTSPTLVSPIYSTPIVVSVSETLKAFATSPGLVNSPVATSVYVIGSTLSITTTSPLPNATQGNVYTDAMAATGGTAPYTWSLTSQTGSNGWTVSSSGIVSGTPGTIETDSLVIKVTDSVLNTASGTFSLQVQSGVGLPSAPANLQVVNQGGPNNGPQTSYTIPAPWPYGGNSGSASGPNDNYQGLSWQPATQGAFPIAKYNIYRNGSLYDSVATPISITGSIIPGTDSVGDTVGVFTVTAVSGGSSANAISDHKLLPGQFLNSVAGGFVPNSRILCYNQANTGGGGTGNYWVDWTQTSSGTFTTWAYNDTAATASIPFNFALNITAPGAVAAATIYAYSVTAVDSNGGEGPHAYPTAYMYQGISRTGRANFNYGGTATWNDTTGSPVLGPYDVQQVSTGGVGSGSFGFLPVWGNGAFGDNSSHSYLGPTQHFEVGAFNFVVADIKFQDTLYLTHQLATIINLRSIGFNGGVDGPNGGPTLDLTQFLFLNGVPVPPASIVINQWYNAKIPINKTPYGIAQVHGSFVATGVCQGTLTITSLDSMTMGYISSSVMVLANSITGSPMPANVYTCGNSTQGGGGSFTDPTTSGGIAGYPAPPLVFHVLGPNIVGTESNTGTYTLQGSMGYKTGWQWNGASYNGGQGNVYMNNIGLSTV